MRDSHYARLATAISMSLSGQYVIKTTEQIASERNAEQSMDLEAEYKLIQAKKSKFSRSRRDAVVRAYENSKQFANDVMESIDD